MTLSTELPLPLGVRLTDVGLRMVEGPVGEVLEDNATLPEKPLMLLRLMVDVLDDP